MAFIVPLIKKEYSLYSRRKSTENKARSASMPLSVHIQSKQDVSVSAPQTPTAPSPSSSAAPVVSRRRSERVSVRRLTSESEETSTSSERHVRFSIAEEICYDDGEDGVFVEEEEDAKTPSMRPKAVSMDDKCLKSCMVRKERTGSLGNCAKESDKRRHTCTQNGNKVAT